ncbi:Bestrophin, RFP-TM, chloride channel-domain-containing protein [Amylostereum chailletii]|nr:Bestrophin, RFP-TM, chloride channel-domain-containing protein [Amylostereum chailletii]
MANSTDAHRTRSATGHHDLLPSAESRGAVLTTIVTPQTLLTWTFGRGTVLWRIWPAVLLHTVFATGVTIISLKTKIYLGIPSVMLTVLGVVIGFVISYRASSGYDRYWMGRSSWSDVIRNARTFTRLVWFHVPLRYTPKTSEETTNAQARNVEEMKAIMREKRTAVDLTEGFVVALKHHLRGEPGLYYEDLYPLTHPLHKHVDHARQPSGYSSSNPPSTSSAIPAILTTPLHDPVIPPINSYGSTHTTIRPRSHVSSRSSSPYSDGEERRPLLPSSFPVPASNFSKASADLVPFANMIRSLFSIYRSRPAEFLDNADGEGGGVQRRWIGETLGHPLGSSSVKHRPRVACHGDNIPLEIIQHLSNWLSVLEERGTVPGTSLGSMVGCLASLEDNLCTLERILTTPLPFVFSVHIRQ